MDKSNINIQNILSKIERTFLSIGSTIGKYRIIEEIDRGGMAVVYKAMQLDLDRIVALKVMPANISINSRFLERFLSEAHSVAKLTHPNIVNIHEVSVENNTYYLVMEYIAGKNLFYYLNFNKPKLIEVLEIVAKLADALAYAHNQKIIHRDLKLNNVIMRDRHTPVLIDFGLAKALETEVTNITRTGEIVGSPAYMAPERLLGTKVDLRSDICSLGIMLYEMLTFKNPYLDQRSIHQTTKNVIEASPIPPRKLVPWLPPETEAITLKAMHPDPDKRYQTMEEMRDDIMRYQRGEPILAHRPSLNTRMRHTFHKYWAPIVISAVVVFFSVLLGLSFYIQNEKEKSHWQVIYQEKFNSRDALENWAIFDSARSADSGSWIIRDGALEAHGRGFTFIRLEHSFARDIRVEFDVGSLGNNFYNVGAFFYGDSPDSGYGFHIHHRGNNACGMTYPGSEFLFYNYEPLDFPATRRYHCVIEKKQNVVSFYLNGVLIGQRSDYFPPLGTAHQKIGFYTRGCACSFDNLKVFQRAIPLSPSPTLIADRFYDRGDFQAALEEYRGLHLDFSNTDLMRQIQTMMPECMLRMGRAREAMDVLERIPPAQLKEQSVLAKVLYLEEIAYNGLGMRHKADSVYAELATQFPSNPLGQSATSRRIVEIARTFTREVNDSAGLDSAQAALMRLEDKFPRFSHEFGKALLEIMNRFTDKGFAQRGIAVGLSVVQRFSRDVAIVSRIQATLGYVYMSELRRQQAVDICNQCISTHVYTEGVWDAWMLLGALYERDHNVADAATIYKKVFDECPHGTICPWMARIKMGEMAAARTPPESPDSIFESVVSAAHPFPLPRMIAQFYRGTMTENQFKAAWSELYPGDRYYLYHFAKKALLSKQNAVARVYLKELVRNLPPISWQASQVNEEMNKLNK